MILKIKAPTIILKNPFSFKKNRKSGVKKIKENIQKKLKGRKAKIPKNADRIGKTIKEICFYKLKILLLDIYNQHKKIQGLQGFTSWYLYWKSCLMVTETEEDLLPSNPWQVSV
ncbi:hypothetical protein HZB04_00445 [Candidatus Wolfebacteria bacterium]|nr:hypothetical protein [Candidatus Wolfebacteria bacterium]